MSDEEQHSEEEDASTDSFIAPQNITDKDVFLHFFKTPNPEKQDIIISHLSAEKDTNAFIKCLHYTVKHEYRNFTKKFFEAVAILNIPKELLVEIFESLPQFEISGYLDTDETYIGLLHNLPHTTRVIEILLSRLFSPPTIQNIYLPFVHSEEALTASFEYFTDPISFDLFYPYLKNLRYNDQLATYFSDDTTYMGRTGVVNMGNTCYLACLLQVLNGDTFFTSKLLKKTTKYLPPFVKELRNAIARIRFIREQSITLTDFAKTLSPSFDPAIQEDVSEYFLQFINRIQDELKEQDDMTKFFRGEIASTIEVGEEKIDTPAESFYHLYLLTKGFTNFEDSFNDFLSGKPMHYNNEMAIKRTKITKWPVYLAVQLQRWDQENTIAKNKLVHEFSFPMEFQRDGSPEYELNAVIVHRGQLEYGHYFAIVHDKDWFMCNDTSIKYFDVNQMRDFAFGIPSDDKNSIYTAYMIFYKVKGADNEVNIADDLASEIDQINAANWPNIVLANPLLVKPIKELYLKDPTNPLVLKIFLNFLFKIASRNDDVLKELIEILTIPDDFEFFEFVIEDLGSDVLKFIYISDTSKELLEELILTNFKKEDFLKDMDTFMPMIKYKARSDNLILLLIKEALSRPIKDWSNYLDLLEAFRSYLIIDKERIETLKLFKEVFGLLNGVVQKLIGVESANDFLKKYFRAESINKMHFYLKKEESFQSLMATAKKLNPALLNSATESSGIVRSYVSSLQNAKATPESDELTDVPFELIWEQMNTIFKSGDEEMLEQAANCFLDILHRCDYSEITHLIDPSLKNMKFVSSLCIHLLTNLEVNSHNSLRIIRRLSKVSPYAVTYILKKLVKVKDALVVSIVNNLMTQDPLFDYQFTEALQNDFFEIECDNDKALYVLTSYPKTGKNSRMLVSLVNRFLEVPLDPLSKKLGDVLEISERLEGVVIPKEAPNYSSLYLVVGLWDKEGVDSECLREYGRTALVRAKPFDIYRKQGVVVKAMEMLKLEYPFEQ